MYAIRGGKILTMAQPGTVDDAMILIEGERIRQINYNLAAAGGYKGD